mgnify:CR=1 FL=1
MPTTKSLGFAIFGKLSTKNTTKLENSSNRFLENITVRIWCRRCNIINLSIVILKMVQKSLRQTVLSEVFSFAESVEFAK